MACDDGRRGGVGATEEKAELIVRGEEGEGGGLEIVKLEGGVERGGGGGRGRGGRRMVMDRWGSSICV